MNLFEIFKNKNLDSPLYSFEYSVDSYERAIIASEGRPEDLDVLVNDESSQVRFAVAEYGRDKDLDKLINDEDSWVRVEVAKHGRPEDLDVLVHDNNKWVRVAVAEHGRPQDLDILVNDKDIDIKNEVLKQFDSSRVRGLDFEARDMSAAKDSQDTSNLNSKNIFIVR